MRVSLVGQETSREEGDLASGFEGAGKGRALGEEDEDEGAEVESGEEEFSL